MTRPDDLHAKGDLSLALRYHVGPDWTSEDSDAPKVDVVVPSLQETLAYLAAESSAVKSEDPTVADG